MASIISAWFFSGICLCSFLEIFIKNSIKWNSSQEIRGSVWGTYRNLRKNLELVVLPYRFSGTKSTSSYSRRRIVGRCRPHRQKTLWLKNFRDEDDKTQTPCPHWFQQPLAGIWSRNIKNKFLNFLIWCKYEFANAFLIFEVNNRD